MPEQPQHISDRRWTDGKWWYSLTALIAVITFVVSIITSIVSTYVSAQVRKTDIDNRIGQVEKAIVGLEQKHESDIDKVMDAIRSDVRRIDTLGMDLHSKVSGIAEDVAQIKGYLNINRSGGRSSYGEPSNAE